MKAGKIRVLLVDDHPIVREGIHLILDREPDIEVVGEADDGAQAVELACSLDPDVVVMDVMMPKMTGVEATRLIHQKNPRVQILILTAHEEEEFITQILRAGASGYILKRDGSAQLLAAIRALHRGESFLDPSVMRTVLKTLAASRNAGSAPVMAKERELTDREIEILRLIACGHTNSQIARKLNISVKTVDTHRSNIAAKLDIHSRVDLVKYAIKKGYISLRD